VCSKAFKALPPQSSCLKSCRGEKQQKQIILQNFKAFKKTEDQKFKIHRFAGLLL
jgi:hypothetical protein